MWDSITPLSTTMAVLDAIMTSISDDDCIVILVDEVIN